MTIFANLFYSAEPLQTSTGSWIVDFYLIKRCVCPKGAGTAERIGGDSQVSAGDANSSPENFEILKLGNANFII